MCRRAVEMSGGNIRRTSIRLRLFLCPRNKIDILTLMSRPSSLRPVVNGLRDLLEICKQFNASQCSRGLGRRWGTRDLNRNATHHPSIILDGDFCRQFVCHSRQWRLSRKLLLKWDWKINLCNTCRQEMVIAENEWWYHHECLEIGEFNWW